MTHYNFDDYLAIGTTPQNTAFQLDFYIRSSALVRAFLMAEKDMVLKAQLPCIYAHMQQLLDTHSATMPPDCTASFCKNMVVYEAAAAPYQQQLKAA